MLTLDPTLPEYACDCHVHVFSPGRFPYAPRRAYTPPAAETAGLLALHRGLGIGRAVLVQPSCYGNDNRGLCAALAEYGRDRARGVAALDADAATDETLRRLHADGVRGLRLNFHVQGAEHAEAQCRAAAARLRGLGWHLQLHVDAAMLRRLAPTLADLPLTVVLDHYAGGAASADTLAQLALHGHVWVKLSAPYRVSETFDELLPLLGLLRTCAADRLVWASDWPHTGGSGGQGRSPDAIEPFRQVDVAAGLRALRGALGDTVFQAVMADNPARLYGF
ncbi:amidohydrolase family protein [Bordetella genomosp. 13]|uniref:amidohydrolase family protein n=1 Tax=Bordetella genomosp. 13 TaxID=463040 RepID=UPI0011A6EB79|nr:amidohydrolase family protein [Bordetella genomosp. 13]